VGVDNIITYQGQLACLSFFFARSAKTKIYAPQKAYISPVGARLTPLNRNASSRTEIRCRSLSASVILSGDEFSRRFFFFIRFRAGQSGALFTIVWFYKSFSGRAERLPERDDTTSARCEASVSQMTLFRPALPARAVFQSVIRKFALWGKSQVDFGDPISLRGN